ncbi:MAG TPA: T9SS type A sorting domain-containing protein [Candidatus Kapabacteria bacterium]|nr:T9SS type A sorting domain-containing protein [Candidatus Kapabacteria bacterium]
MARFLFIILFSFTITSPCYAQWLQSSGPAGSGVSDFSILGNKLFSASFDGIYASTDYGKTWEYSNFTQPVSSLCVIGNKILAMNNYQDHGLYQSDDSGISWHQLFPNTWVGQARTDNTRLFALTSDGIFMSEDSGKIWIQIDSQINGNVFRGQLDLVGNGVLYRDDYGITVYRTTDLGRTWQRFDSTGFNISQKIVVVDDTTAFAEINTNSGAALIQSKDGIHWSIVDSTNILNISSLNTGIRIGNSIMLGGWNGLLISMNDGKSWSHYTNLGEQQIDVAVLKVSGEMVFAGCRKGVYISNDTGLTWTAMQQDIGDRSLTAIGSSSSLILAGGVNGRLFETTDNGLHWNTVSSFDSVRRINEIQFVGTNAFVCSTSGFYKSIDNGDNWSLLTGSIPDSNVTCFLFAGSRMYIGTWNGIFRSTDFGKSWQEVNNGLANLYALSLCSNDQYLFAGTANGIFRSEDFGDHWVRKSDGLSSVDVQNFSTDPPYIFAGTTNTICRSSDNGEHWQSLDSPSVDIMAMKTINNVIIASTGLPVEVYASTNHGDSWKIISDGIDKDWIQGTYPKITSFANDGQFIYAASDGQGVWKRKIDEKITADVRQPISIPSSTISSFPNPCNDESTIRFTLSNPSIASVVLTDILGKQVTLVRNTSYNAGTYDLPINLTGYSSGIYSCKVITRDGMQEIKIVKAK